MSATSAPICSSEVNRPKSVYRRAVVRVVVAGADVHVVAHAVALAAHDEDALGVRLQRRDGRRRRARPPPPARCAQWMFARSSKRALSSTRQTACLPRSAARISAGTSGESSLVRYTVCLIASTSGSATACSTKRSTEVDERVVGVVDEDVALAHRARSTSTRLVVLALQARLGHRRPRRVAQLGEARQLDDLPQVAEVEQAVDVVDLALLDLERLDRAARAAPALMPAPTSTRTTSPKRRRRSSSSTACSRSSASSETVKSASRVTRKTPWSTISMPGNSASRLRGDHVLERHERSCPSPTGTKRGSISFGTFTRANVVTCVCGSRTSTAERQREVGDVGERAARGRPPAASAPGRSGAGSARRARSRSSSLDARRAATIADAVLGQRRAQLALEAARLARGRARRSRSRIASIVSRRRAAVGAAGRRSRRRPGRAGRRRGP